MEDVQQFLSDVFAKAWNTFKVDPVLYVVGSILVGIASIFTLGILAGPTTVGFIRVMKKRREGQAAGLGDIFDFSSFGASFVVVLLVAIAALIGLLLLVLPGVLVLIFASFALYDVAYKNSGAIDAIQNSVAMVKEHFLNVIALMIVVWVINMIGGSIMLGALLTTPFGLLMVGIAYEKIALRNSSQSQSPMVGRFDPPPSHMY